MKKRIKLVGSIAQHGNVRITGLSPFQIGVLLNLLDMGKFINDTVHIISDERKHSFEFCHTPTYAKVFVSRNTFNVMTGVKLKRPSYTVALKGYHYDGSDLRALTEHVIKSLRIMFGACGIDYYSIENLYPPVKSALVGLGHAHIEEEAA